MLEDDNTIPPMAAFSLAFVTIGLCCFVWQSITAGCMFLKSRKPIVGLVFAQATLGIAVTIVTLITSVKPIDCTFRLLFSVLGVNLADITLQFVLLWKAYLGNNRSKVVLIVGCVPLVSIAIFIIINFTWGKSGTAYAVGYCATDYPIAIVIAKTVIDCSSNAFLSGCFILVIYRHYRILGSSVQKILLTEGLLYCFGVCLSNIVTGILLVLYVFGGNTPILYTVDWYLASYLIVKQLQRKQIHVSEETAKGTEGESIEAAGNEGDFEDFEGLSTKSSKEINSFRKQSMSDEEQLKRPRERNADAYYSMGSTVIASSPTTPPTRYSSTIEEEKCAYYGYPSLPEGITVKR